MGDVYSCRFFPSGKVVLSGGADLRLKIWTVRVPEHSLGTQEVCQANVL